MTPCHTCLLKNMSDVVLHCGNHLLYPHYCTKVFVNHLIPRDFCHVLYPSQHHHLPYIQCCGRVGLNHGLEELHAYFVWIFQPCTREGGLEFVFLPEPRSLARLVEVFSQCPDACFGAKVSDPLLARPLIRLEDNPIIKGLNDDSGSDCVVLPPNLDSLVVGLTI